MFVIFYKSTKIFHQAQIPQSKLYRPKWYLGLGGPVAPVSGGNWAHQTYIYIKKKTI